MGLGSEINRSAAYQTEWIHCPVCSNKIQDWRIKKIEQRKIRKECAEHSCYRPAERRRKPKIIAVCRRLRSVRSGIYAAVMQRQRPTARAVGGALAVAKYAL